MLHSLTQLAEADKTKHTEKKNCPIWEIQDTIILVLNCNLQFLKSIVNRFSTKSCLSK